MLANVASMGFLKNSSSPKISSGCHANEEEKAKCISRFFLVCVCSSAYTRRVGNGQNSLYSFEHLAPCACVCVRVRLSETLWFRRDRSCVCKCMNTIMHVMFECE